MASIFATDGLRTILNDPMECPECHGMHYFFINTLEGHRCPGCANGKRFDSQTSIAAEIVKRGFDTSKKHHHSLPVVCPEC